MHTERKILANLAWRVYKARQKMRNYGRLYLYSDKKFLYYESLYEWVSLQNAFKAAKQIYFNNLPKD